MEELDQHRSKDIVGDAVPLAGEAQVPAGAVFANGKKPRPSTPTEPRRIADPATCEW